MSIGSGDDRVAAIPSVMRLYSLFYVDRQQTKHINLRKTADDAAIYLGCGSLLAKSAKYHGVEFSLITNDAEFVGARLREMGAEHVKTIEHRFELDVPADIEFHAAHFKLELFRAFGSGAFGELLALVDIDAVLLRPFPEWVHQMRGLLAYEISEQVCPEYGTKKIIEDLTTVAGYSVSAPVWYGGEFILGQAREFGCLARYVELCWPAYVRNLRTLHHLGDETVLSASLTLARRDGELINDVGPSGLVARWWTARTGFVQKPLRSASAATVLHLPADKEFLAAQSRGAFNPTEFLKSYESYARKKLFLRKVYNNTIGTLDRQRRYVGSIS